MGRKPELRVGQKTDDYVLEALLGAGQDGEVWRVAKKSLGKTFAAKFLNSIEEEEKSQRFEREIRILADLNHPHIISIVDKGDAWNPTTGKVVPYYVMEFVEALPIDTSFKHVPPNEILTTFCTLFQQVASAIAEVHNRGISHGDIKPANILVLVRNRVAKLSDFGFGLLPGETATKRTEYPASSYRTPENFSPKEADIYKLGRTFRDCLVAVQEHLLAQQTKAIEELLATLIESPSTISLETVSSRLTSVMDLTHKAGLLYYEELDSLVPEISGTRKSALQLQDPLRGDIYLTQRCLAIVDLPQFQRLRTLRTVPAHELVYPSMSQTRLEDTMGQYAIVLDYLKWLSNLPEFRAIVQPVHQRGAILTSLIRDIGQYPFSSHVNFASRIRSCDPGVLGASMITKAPIASIIEESWDLDPRIVASLLTEVPPETDSKAWALILSVLSGPLSAPRVDFVTRVAWRAGVTPGFDVKRLISSLRITPEGNALAINIGDVSVLESFLMASYALSERVFQHRTVIAADCMLIHAFHELASAGFDFRSLFQSDDWTFLKACINEAQERSLQRAENLLRSFSQRKLHKQVATWHRNGVSLMPSISDQVDYSARLEKKFSKRLGEEFPAGSMIFNSPAVRRVGPSIKLLSGGKESRAEDVSAVLASIWAKSGVDSLNRFRLFVAPEIAGTVRQLGQEEIDTIVYSLLFETQ